MGLAHMRSPSSQLVDFWLIEASSARPHARRTAGLERAHGEAYDDLMCARMWLAISSSVACQVSVAPSLIFRALQTNPAVFEHQPCLLGSALPPLLKGHSSVTLPLNPARFLPGFGSVPLAGIAS